MQEVRTKNEKTLQKLEVIVFDETHAAFKLTMFTIRMIQGVVDFTTERFLISSQ